jgi:YgiT-type zinc finger domain-containing protein
MKCVICRKGETAPGQTTVTLQRGETTVVIKGVPADICENCGEQYFSAELTGKLLAQAEQAVKNGAEVEIVRFAA